jgi:phage terminase large subunit
MTSPSIDPASLSKLEEALQDELKERKNNRWSPRPYQRAVWDYLQAGGKRAFLLWHRRSGKDELCLRFAFEAATRRVGNYWYLLPQQEHARKAIWRAVDPHKGKRRIDLAFPLSARATTRENEMMIELKNGSTWQVLGSDNYNALVGSPPVGIVLSEWALSDPQAWSYLAPALEENGGWAVFNGTPRGPNHAKTLFEYADSNPDWFAERLTADETNVFTPAQLERIQQESIALYGEDHGLAIFEQEYMCSFDAAVLGTYYGGEMAAAERDGRISNVLYDPAVRVITAWDLGIGDSTAIWFVQIVGKEIHVIDYYEAAGQGLTHYVHMLANKPYFYDRHILPHDVQARELGIGTTRLEHLESLGLRRGFHGPIEIAPKQQDEEGINAVRMLIPRCWFDATKCRKGVEALKLFRTEWDEANRVFRRKPLHDWTSHAADAFAYLALVINDLVTPRYTGPINYPREWGMVP